jgi:hypothetical protein
MDLVVLPKERILDVNPNSPNIGTSIVKWEMSDRSPDRHSYTMKEIAEHLGLRYATIIRAMKRVERGSNVWLQDLTPSPNIKNR